VNDPRRGIQLTDYLVLGIYVALALAFTWPVVSVVATATMGDGSDGWQESWEMWWLNRAIQTGSMPYHFSTLYAPYGATNYLHSFNPIENVLTLPVQWAFGPIAAYNTACWMAIFLTAFGAYLLGRDVTGNRAAGFVAGLILGFAPHQMAQLLGHMDVASIQFYVLGVWCLYRSFSSTDRSLAWALWSGACLAASALSHPYSLIYGLITLPLMGAAWSIRRFVDGRGDAPGDRPIRRRLQPALNALIALTVGLAVVSPLLIAMARQLTGHEAPRRRDIPAEVIEEREGFSADLMAYAMPSPYNPLWGAASKRAAGVTTEGVEKVVFPGYVAMALGLVGAFARSTRRRAAFWALLGVTGLLLSLGPTLHVWGVSTFSPMPATLFYFLPGSFTVRVPARFSVMLLLGLCICSALGTLALLRSRAFRRLRLPTFAAILLLIGLEFLPVPYPTAPFVVERWFDKVAGASERTAVLDVPFEPGYSRPLMWQMASGMPLAGGYLSRQPVDPLSGGAPPFPEFGLNRPPQIDIYDRAVDNLCRPLPDRSSYLDVMRLAGVRFLVLHLDALDQSDPRINMAAELFPTPPVYRSDTLMVYDAGGGDAPASLFGMAEDTEDWFPVEGGKLRWAFTKPARIHVWSGANRELTLQFKARSFPGERDLTISVAGKPLLTERIGLDELPIVLKWTVPKGFSTLALTVSGSAISPKEAGLGGDGRPLSLAISECSYSVR